MTKIYEFNCMLRERFVSAGKLIIKEVLLKFIISVLTLLIRLDDLKHPFF